MKIVIFSLTLLLSTLSIANEAPRFSAFSYGDDLYVTILGDSCNNFRGSLIVAENCKDDKASRNRAIACDADLQVSMTTIACHDKKPFAIVMAMSLSGNNIAKEAQQLFLKYNGQEIEVDIERK